MEDGVPVGVLIQTKPKPGVKYLVLGLAPVIDWTNGYFFLEGYNSVGQVSSRSGAEDASSDRARVETLLPSKPDFDPDQQSDQRAKSIAEVVHRRGQAKCRQALLEAYDGKCAITGCDAVEALEAAHITPYLGDETNHPQNGLLLRADIQSLFDLGLLAIDPKSLKVVLADSLRESTYSNLHQRSIISVTDPGTAPTKAAIQRHFDWSGISNSD